jgi:hypothetical protein
MRCFRPCGSKPRKDIARSIECKDLRKRLPGASNPSVNSWSCETLSALFGVAYDQTTLNPDPQLGKLWATYREERPSQCVRICVRKETTIKVGVREFRERIASFLESDSPVAVTRRGETLGGLCPDAEEASEERRPR